MLALAVVEKDSIFKEVSCGDTERLRSLFVEHAKAKAEIELVSNTLSKSGAAVNYFMKTTGYYKMGNIFCNSLFDKDSKEKAIKALDAEFWDRALSMTDVYDAMPAAKQIEWKESIDTSNIPEFTEETVITTIGELLSSRLDFFAQRIEGVFMALSKTHKTNSAFCFHQKMILNSDPRDLTNGPEYKRNLVIDDLRKLVAIISGRGQLSSDNLGTNALIELLSQSYNKFVDIDCNTISIKVCKVGTVHLEIHPDIATQMNEILAIRLGKAIPAPKKTSFKRSSHINDKPVIAGGLELDVIAKLHSLYYHKGNLVRFREECPELRTKIQAVLESLGGKLTDERPKIRELREIRENVPFFKFDYNPEEVIKQIIITGYVPEKITH